MPSKTLILILMAVSQLGGCIFSSSSSPQPDPCTSNPNLAGCTGGTGTPSSTTLDTNNVASVVSTTLHDLLDIAQVLLTSVIKGQDYKTDILSLQNAVHPSDPKNDPASAPPSYTVACDNSPNSYTVAIQQDAPGYTQGGTVVSINLGGSTPNGSIDPAVYCQLGSINVSGLVDIAQVIFTDDATEPGNWMMGGEVWPNLTRHNGASLTTINNPLSFTASYTAADGLVVTGTVMTNPFRNDNLIDGGNVDGMVFTHFAAGTDPNSSSTSSSDILWTDSVITVRMDVTDPLAATQLSMAVDGTLTSDRIGTDIVMRAQTTDTTSTSQPLTWTTNIAYGPEAEPPSNGAFFIADTGTGNSIAASFTDNQGAMELTVTDGSGTTTLQTDWAVLMQMH